MVYFIERLSAFLGTVLSLYSMPAFCFYLLMIFSSGFWHRFTRPLKLRLLLIIHNFACCLGSLLTLLGFIYGVWKSGSLYSRASTKTLTWCFGLYWSTKVLELLDTLYMVLRHKSCQISFLHVYHHASMLLLSELAYQFYPWPAIAVFLGLNSFVHVLLYFYYGMTAFAPDNPPKWKKSMTQIQIGQFLLGFIIALQGYFHHGYCVYSLLYGLTMTLLFSNFYYHSYVKQHSSKNKEYVQQNGKTE